MPNGWAASAGGFPAMAGNVPFLMKDVVLFAVSVYLLKQGQLCTLQTDWNMQHYGQRWSPQMSIHLTNPIFNDETAAWQHFEAVRWSDGPVCPHCGVINSAD